ncbi:hypothetical protein PAXRUDRAFT_36280 [Paxillus rubicundulus Ve08.2h10]|uniref:Uncharacterized protein n=1 Tax=Paxillus rubicundulus Ve08.2h10 TaxID=930991 RepID=A0A0D0D8R3_9AGAM|nr:hypothetical protein PAXRUDRAFT_36280 [Paxillus rubicundulus Ve08.2h10]
MHNCGSGPEDDSDEAKEVWKTDMVRKAGLAADADLDSMSFLEVMKCPWCSRESPCIPKDTPHDFGINMEWFNVNKDTTGLFYGDPEGCGLKKLCEADGKHGDTGNEGSPSAGPSNI